MLPAAFADINIGKDNPTADRTLRANLTGIAF
jgi:hypothetical protein